MARHTRFGEMKFLLTVHGLSSVAHFPDESINTPAVAWSEMDTGAGVPPEATQMEDIEATDDGDSTERRFQELDPDRHNDDDDDGGLLGIFGG